MRSTGLDRSADLLRAAEMRSDTDLANLRWHHAEFHRILTTARVAG